MNNPLLSYQYCTVKVASQFPEQAMLTIEAAPAASDPTEGPTGEAGEVMLVREGSERRLAVSLGKPEKINPETLRQAGSSVVRWLAKNQVEQARMAMAGLIKLAGIDGAAAFIEGACLGAFRFNRYKKPKDQPAVSPALYLAAGEQAAALAQKASEIETICAATNLARDWAHEPANVINPVSLAERVQQLFEGSPVSVTVIDDRQLAEMKAGAILAVGQGSRTPARLIILSYPGQGRRTGEAPVVLVGKTITFDSGGYSLKSVEGIVGMKYDKGGGMAVIAALQAAASLQLSHPLVGVIAAAENMISDKSYRPDDILTTLSGKTVEIVSTDAEGRLVLADALTYAQKEFHPKALIDLATLTGGAIVALGYVRAPILSNNDALTQALTSASEATHERLWRLPLDEEYSKLLQGDDGDIKNSGGREASTIQGGVFLKEFIEESTPWAHLDIAGMAMVPKEMPYSPKGATGFGVRLLVRYLQSLE